MVPPEREKVKRKLSDADSYNEFGSVISGKEFKDDKKYPKMQMPKKVIFPIDEAELGHESETTHGGRGVSPIPFRNR